MSAMVDINCLALVKETSIRNFLLCRQAGGAREGLRPRKDPKNEFVESKMLLERKG